MPPLWITYIGEKGKKYINRKEDKLHCKKGGKKTPRNKHEGTKPKRGWGVGDLPPNDTHPK